MALSASDMHRIYRPSKCDLRIYLHHKGVQEAEPGPFDEVIKRLGERHEKAHLAAFANVTDIASLPPDQREQETIAAIKAGAPVIYQGVFTAAMKLGEHDCDVTGIPDFLIREGGGCVIRDAKIARRINEKDHPEIIWQVRLYGRLFEIATGHKPLRLEVFGGAGEIVPVELAAEGAVEAELARYLEVIESAEPPFEPVGWTKCGDCGHNARCWKEAEERRDAALVPRVDQNLARALRERKIISFDELLTAFDEDGLSKVEKPWGKKTQKVGKAAGDILRSARALQTSKVIPIAPPEIPPAANFVMFDLEGLPPHLDAIEKIYLWGMQVFGEKPSVFIPATAGFGADGDREGWESFLRAASQIMNEHGNIPFVHWSHYERTKLGAYIERHGDPDGIAAAVRENLFDLLPAMQKSVALPLPSYSLKVIEKFVGFKRTRAEFGGEWSMAKYIEATEMQDAKARDAVLAEILKYNEEDLAATWAVLRWLRDYGRGAQGG